MVVYVALCDYGSYEGQRVMGVALSWEGAAHLHRHANGENLTLTEFGKERGARDGISFRSARYDRYIIRCQTGQDISDII